MAHGDSNLENQSDNQKWREGLPPELTEKQKAASIGAIKIYNQELEEFGTKMSKARDIYIRMYEDDPRIWQILTFEEKVKEVIKRLAEDGTTLNEPEKIALRTALKTSTKVMYTTEDAVDAHDGENKDQAIFPLNKIFDNYNGSIKPLSVGLPAPGRGSRYKKASISHIYNKYRALPSAIHFSSDIVSFICYN